MKIFLVFFISVLFIIPKKSFGQLLINVETGISNFGVHSNSNDNLKKEWGKQEYIQAYRLGLKKRWKFDRIVFETGFMVNFVGANHFFLGHWRYINAGFSFGTQYEIGRVSLGLRSTPAIELWNTWPVAFEPKRSYNIDLEPNLAWNIGKRIQLTGGASFGLNPAVEFTKDAIYSHVSYLIGVNYFLMKYN